MNLLPRDGNVTYHPNFLKPEEADSSLQLILKTQEWQPDVVKMFGKEITTGRKVIWYGDPNCTYTYSGKLKTPTPWHALVLQLKTITELHTNHLYNSCLANLYHNGDEGMGWHSDNEKELGKEPNISVISLGAERKFKFKHRQTKEVVDLTLEHGSLLTMSGSTQQHWLHTLPKTKKIHEPRVSLTYRKIFN